MENEVELIDDDNHEGDNVVDQTDDVIESRQSHALTSNKLPEMLNSELSRIESLGDKLTSLEEILLSDEALENADPADLLKIYNTISKSRQASSMFITKMMELGMEAKVFDRLLGNAPPQAHPDKLSKEDKEERSKAKFILQTLLKKRCSDD